MWLKHSITSNSEGSNKMAGSFASTKKKQAEVYLNIDYDRLFNRQEIEADALIDRIEPPSTLYDAVFNSQAEGLSNGIFPDGTKDEAKKSNFINRTLAPILCQIRKEFKIAIEDLHISFQNELNPVVDSAFLEDSKGRLDFVVHRKDSNRRLAHLVILEVKIGDIDTAVIQATLDMVRVAEHNDDQLPVYCICTNAIEYSLLKYDPAAPKEDNGQFKMMFRRTGMLPGLHETTTVIKSGKKKKIHTRKQEWMRRCRYVVKVIYSCLHYQVRKQEEREKVCKSGAKPTSKSVGKSANKSADKMPVKSTSQVDNSARKPTRMATSKTTGSNNRKRNLHAPNYPNKKCKLN